MAEQGENQALIDAMERLSEPVRVLGDDAAPMVVAVPRGMELKSLKKLLDEYRERPERKTGTTTLTTLEAFCAFVNRHRERESAVFCDDTNEKAPKLVALFNAHSASASLETLATDPNADARGEADWQDHRALYAFPLSEEWKIWTALVPAMSQADFAHFLEDRITDVLDPDQAGDVAKEYAASVKATLATPARMLELSRGLTVHLDGRVSQELNLKSGEGKLVFTEEHKDAAGQRIDVPGAFAIGIPVFRGGVAYKIPVRLRYRVSQGSVSWSLAVQRLDRVFEAAIAEACTLVAQATHLPVFRGAPG